MVTQFPSLITQYFSHYLWVSYLSLVQLFLFLFSSGPKLTEPSEKNNNNNRTDPTIEKNKEKKKRKEKKKPRTDGTANPGEKKKKTKQPTQRRKEKKKLKVKSCSWVLFGGLLCVFNYNIAIELWVMETENSQNVFSVFITHNSKIRELSDGNHGFKNRYGEWTEKISNYRFYGRSEVRSMVEPMTS